MSDFLSNRHNEAELTTKMHFPFIAPRVKTPSLLLLMRLLRNTTTFSGTCLLTRGKGEKGEAREVGGGRLVKSLH